MKGTDLLILKAELDIESNAEMARQLGISRSTFYRMLLQESVPRPLALTCAALRAGLEPYTPPKTFDRLKYEAYSAATLHWLKMHGLSPEQSCADGGKPAALGKPHQPVIEPHAGEPAHVD